MQYRAMLGSTAVSVTLWSWSKKCGCVQGSECYVMIMKWKVWLCAVQWVLRYDHDHEMKGVAVCSAVSVTLWSWSWSERCGCAVQWVLHYDQEVKSGCVHYSECYIMTVKCTVCCCVMYSECYITISRWKVWLCAAQCYIMIVKCIVCCCMQYSVLHYDNEWKAWLCAVQWVLHYDQEVKGVAVCSTASVTVMKWKLLLCAVQWVLHYDEEVKGVMHSKCYNHEVKVVAVCSAVTVTLWWSKRCVAVCSTVSVTLWSGSERCVAVCSTVLHYDEVKDVLLCVVQCYIMIRKWKMCCCVQYYAMLGGDRYVDLGLGTHRVKCRVDRQFRYELEGFLSCEGHHVSMFPCLSVKGIMFQWFLVFL